MSQSHAHPAEGDHARPGFVRRWLNPWGPSATTLEWTLPSPPPFHTYEDVPVVK